MTYFVVPVIVVEKLGPLAAGKRSFEVLKRTWGESLVANFGVGINRLPGHAVGRRPGSFGRLRDSEWHDRVGDCGAIAVGVIALLSISLVLLLPR